MFSFNDDGVIRVYAILIEDNKQATVITYILAGV